MRPESFQPPVRLEGRYLRLEPLGPEHAEALAPIWARPEVHRYLIGFEPDPARPDVRGMIRTLLERQNAGSDLPFAVVRVSDGRPIGMTRYLDIQPRHNKVEIGGTWYDPRVWRTPLNTESKLLLLRHAFETGDAHRVVLKTDLRNERSRRAIARLGAKQEAVVREHLWLSEGFYRTSVYFRILRPEWPEVEARLEEWLARPWSGSGATPESARPSGAGTPASPPPEPRPSSEMGFRAPITLGGRYVELAPLETHHAADLQRAGRDPAIWQFMRWGGGRPVEEMIPVVLAELKEGQAKGEVLPFVILHLPERRVSGVFRFLNIDRPNRIAELGTWVDSAYWQTPVNTEVKYLALVYAFEQERVHRIQLQTDARNVRSQRAIERLGAVPEGAHEENVLLPEGRYRTSKMYSILESEWPTVKRRLEAKLAVPWSLTGTPPPPAE
jgi:N-acetyltransferase